MSVIRFLKIIIYNLIRTYRWKFIDRLLDVDSKTLLDIGCKEVYTRNRLKGRYDVTIADISPKDKLIRKEDVQNLSFKDKSFDSVLCMEVLEHVPNPIKAISELKRVTKKQLIISVPYEPFFTLFRFLSWEKEHLWVITPKVLKIYLGKPCFERKIFFKRYYLGVWKLS